MLFVICGVIYPILTTMPYFSYLITPCRFLEEQMIILVLCMWDLIWTIWENVEFGNIGENRLRHRESRKVRGVKMRFETVCDPFSKKKSRWGWLIHRVWVSNKLFGGRYVGLGYEHLKTAWNFGVLLNKMKTVMLHFWVYAMAAGWIEGFWNNGKAILRDLLMDMNDSVFCFSCMYVPSSLSWLVP